jgi:dihydropteroate synthase
MDGPLIAGIVNVTPDSFSDGGQFDGVEDAVGHALALAQAGADWVDIGGESTRPGAAPVSVGDEIARVVPVIRALAARAPGVVISVDTRRAAVAAQACAAGASVVNDVSALGDSQMAEVVRRADAQLVLMHMRGTPKTMQHDTRYGDLVSEVVSYLEARAAVATAAGISAAKILLDPGIGFGKAPSDNPLLFAAIPRLAKLGYRTFVGASRKRFIGTLTGVINPQERVAGSVGAALAAATWGADVIRVHDVAETRDALTVFRACGMHR